MSPKSKNPVDPFENFLDYAEGVKPPKLTTLVLLRAQVIMRNPQLAFKRSKFFGRFRHREREAGGENLNSLLIPLSNNGELLISADELSLLIRYGFVEAYTQGLVDWKVICRCMHQPEFLACFTSKLLDKARAGDLAPCWH